MREKKWLLIPLVLLTLTGCKSNKWIQGKWLLITEEGKPGTCHFFQDDGNLTVFSSAACDSPKDPVLSGKYELQDKDRLAILRLNEPKAKLALISEHDKNHFVSRGTVSGTFFHMDTDKPDALLAKLETDGVIKVKALPPADGCDALDLDLEKIKALPKEESPRMLRFKDQSLQYHANTKTGDPRIEKVVYALNQEELEWIALHLAQTAFDPPGPQARLEESLGRPLQAIATGSGAKRQHIAMWKAYCSQLRGAANADIDVTLFATTGERRGTIYLSEGVVSGLWEELRSTATNPANADDSEDEEGAADQQAAPAQQATAPAQQAAAPAKAAAAPPPAPKAAKPAPTPPPAPKAATPPPKRTGTESGAREGDDDL